MSDMARLLDHEGNWIPPFPIGEVITCRAADVTWDHKLFGSSQVRPGDNAFQAMTFCGRRALEVPGRGSEVTCPACLEHMGEDTPEPRSHEDMFGEPEPIDRTADDGPNFQVPYLDGDNIVKNWHHRGP